MTEMAELIIELTGSSSPDHLPAPARGRSPGPPAGHRQGQEAPWAGSPRFRCARGCSQDGGVVHVETTTSGNEVASEVPGHRSHLSTRRTTSRELVPEGSRAGSGDRDYWWWTTTPSDGTGKGRGRARAERATAARPASSRPRWGWEPPTWPGSATPWSGTTTWCWRWMRTSATTPIPSPPFWRR